MLSALGYLKALGVMTKKAIQALESKRVQLNRLSVSGVYLYPHASNKGNSSHKAYVVASMLLAVALLFCNRARLGDDSGQ
jgi:hypothetical protein